MVALLPKAPEDLAQDLNMEVKAVKEELDRLYDRGIVFPRNFETREGHRFARTVTQLHDATQSILSPLNRRLHSEGQERELFQLWEDFCAKEWEPQRMPQLAKLEKPASRVIPAYKAIKDMPGLLPSENIREILKYQQTIAVVSCSCRRRKELVAKHCDRSHDVNCMQFNRGAEYALNRGSGKRLSLDEAIALFDKIEDDGLVHTWENSDAMTRTVMCNCCPDCCMNMHPMLEYGVPLTSYYAKSRFEARADQGLCTGCQDCVERCSFNAISMEKPTGSRKYKAVVDAEKCMGCGVCVLICAPEALRMAQVRPPQHIPAAAK